MDYLQQVWEIAQQWEAQWDEWKGGQLASLQTEVMDNAGQTVFERLHKLSREFKASQHNLLLVLNLRQFRDQACI